MSISSCSIAPPSARPISRYLPCRARACRELITTLPGSATSIATSAKTATFFATFAARFTASHHANLLELRISPLDHPAQYRKAARMAMPLAGGPPSPAGERAGWHAPPHRQARRFTRFVPALNMSLAPPCYHPMAALRDSGTHFAANSAGRGHGLGYPAQAHRLAPIAAPHHGLSARSRPRRAGASINHR